LERRKYEANIGNVFDGGSGLRAGGSTFTHIVVFKPM
jgi:hypothetical protein